MTKYMHTKHKTRDDMYARMREMLDDGEGFILVGFVKRPGGIQPVSFTRGCSDEVAEVVDDLTSVIAVQIMAQVTNNRDCKYAKGN